MLNHAGFARIKRRSAFAKHLKAKHDIDLSKMSTEEVGAAACLIRVSPDAERIATPPPDYTTATKEPMYKEEDLPTFSLGVVPKEEVHTPPSVTTPPPAVIDIVPSSEGYKWSECFVGTCFHLRVVLFASLLTGDLVNRPRVVRLRFPRSGVAGRSGTPSSKLDAWRELLLSGYRYPTTTLILRSAVVRDHIFHLITPLSCLCRFGRYTQLFPTTLHFRHELHFRLRLQQLWSFELPNLVLEGCWRYARLYEHRSYDLLPHLLFRMMDVQKICTNASHLSRCGHENVSLASLARF